MYIFQYVQWLAAEIGIFAIIHLQGACIVNPNYIYISLIILSKFEIIFRWKYTYGVEYFYRLNLTEMSSKLFYRIFITLRASYLFCCIS